MLEKEDVVLIYSKSLVLVMVRISDNPARTVSYSMHSTKGLSVDAILAVIISGTLFKHTPLS